MKSGDQAAREAQMKKDELQVSAVSILYRIYELQSAYMRSGDCPRFSAVFKA